MATNTVSDISPAGGGGEPQITTVGSSKPLHRFIRAEPKCAGIAMVFMGSSLFIFGIPMRNDNTQSTSAEDFTSFWLGILFIISGMLYVLTEKSPSKPMVTASLALSIISILGVVVAFFEFLKGIMHSRYGLYRYEHFEDYAANVTEIPWNKYHMNQLICMEAIFMCQSFVGMTLLIVMTVFARAALRSSKTQAIVVMHNLPSTD
ncbi:uncharacterized protein LOC799862 homolog [Esox lucius]|uniref:Membrane-spanning 4-domains subfamily A member 15 n=1 Tax=Esox lucius TaxID=8010 RepID=C1BW04_ESOLU|nr:uncharacterized protein LOC799862 homolog [Esox lucius]ACO13207.1 Membrane-spanning 4-domains subfamily A member 15 [Esox lucius]